MEATNNKTSKVDLFLIDSLSQIERLQPGSSTTLVPGYGLSATKETTVPAYCADVTNRVNNLSKKLTDYTMPSWQTVEKAEQLIKAIKSKIIDCDSDNNSTPQPVYNALDALQNLSKQITMDLSKAPIEYAFLCVAKIVKVSNAIVAASWIKYELPEEFTCMTQRARPFDVSAGDSLVFIDVKKEKEYRTISLPMSFLRKNVAQSGIHLELSGKPIFIQMNSEQLKEELGQGEEKSCNSYSTSLVSSDEDPHGLRPAYQLLPGEFQFKIRKGRFVKDTEPFYPFSGSTKASVKIENETAKTPMVFDPKDSYTIQLEKWQEHLEAQKSKGQKNLADNTVTNAPYEIITYPDTDKRVLENTLAIHVLFSGNNNRSIPYVKLLVRKRIVVIALERPENFDSAWKRPAEKKCVYFEWENYFPGLTHIQVAKLFEAAQVGMSNGLLEIEVPTKQ